MKQKVVCICVRNEPPQVSMPRNYLQSKPNRWPAGGAEHSGQTVGICKVHTSSPWITSHPVQPGKSGSQHQERGLACTGAEVLPFRPADFQGEAFLVEVRFRALVCPCRDFTTARAPMWNALLNSSFKVLSPAVISSDHNLIFTGSDLPGLW